MKWLLELRKGTAVLVTGTPGTGKTTISRLLSRSVDAEYVSLRMLLTCREKDYEYDENRRTRIVSPRRLRSSLMRQASRAVRGLVIDSHIAFKIGPSPVIARVIVLRCSPSALQRRLRKKNWPRHKVNENLLAEILDVCLWDAVQNYGWQRISEIDTTNKRPKEVLDIALRALRQKANQKKPKVDWLSRLAREGMLERYLI